MNGSDRALDVLRLETALQCRFVLISADDLDVAQRNRDGHAVIWHALQGVLVSAANISKLLWGQDDGDNPVRVKLRAEIGVDERSPLFDRRLRNDFEHFDERLLDWVHKPKNAEAPYVGRNIFHVPAGVNFIADEEPGRRFGHFDNVTMTVTFWRHEVDLHAVVDEVSRILGILDPQG